MLGFGLRVLVLAVMVAVVALGVSVTVVTLSVAFALIAGVVGHDLRTACPGRLAWSPEGLVIDLEHFEGGRVGGPVVLLGLRIFFSPGIGIGVWAFSVLRTLYLAYDRYLLVGILIQGINRAAVEPARPDLKVVCFLA